MALRVNPVDNPRGGLHAFAIHNCQPPVSWIPVESKLITTILYSICRTKRCDASTSTYLRSFLTSWHLGDATYGCVAMLPCHLMCRKAQESGLSYFAKYLRRPHKKASVRSRAVSEASGKADKGYNLHDYVLGDKPSCSGSAVHSRHH